jgi:hypothetical protein
MPRVVRRGATCFSTEPLAQRPGSFLRTDGADRAQRIAVVGSGERSPRRLGRIRWRPRQRDPFIGAQALSVLKCNPPRICQERSRRAFPNFPVGFRNKTRSALRPAFDSPGTLLRLRDTASCLERSDVFSGVDDCSAPFPHLPNGKVSFICS